MFRSPSAYRPLAVAVLAAGSVVLVGTTTASGALVSNARFHDSSTELFDDFCGDMHVQRTFDVYVHELVRTKNTGELLYFSTNAHGSMTDTNLATDKSFTTTFAFNDRDQHITDNGDSTITIVAAGSGVTKSFGPDGELLFLDAGMSQIQFDIDLNGTPTDVSDDTFVEGSFELLKQAGRADTAGRDYCEDFRAITG